jgi:hypothetical protein
MLDATAILFGLGGMAAMTYGCFLIYGPAGWIYGGFCLLLIAARLAQQAQAKASDG